MEPREIGPIHSAGDDRAQNCSTFELNESQQQILNELDEVIQQQEAVLPQVDATHKAEPQGMPSTEKPQPCHKKSALRRAPVCSMLHQFLFGPDNYIGHTHLSVAQQIEELLSQFTVIARERPVQALYRLRMHERTQVELLRRYLGELKQCGDTDHGFYSQMFNLLECLWVCSRRVPLCEVLRRRRAGK